MLNPIVTDPLPLALEINHEYLDLETVLTHVFYQSKDVATLPSVTLVRLAQVTIDATRPIRLTHIITSEERNDAHIATMLLLSYLELIYQYGSNNLDPNYVFSHLRIKAQDTSALDLHPF